MVLGPVLAVLLVVLLVALAVPLLRSIGGDRGASRADTARDILDARYAKGEIDREEYLRRRADINGE